ncbi:Hypothetical predicted protein [Paramuricea clavata]|uniref:Uncharacterized protein n=1 Tax=Paramuricea clavata TaxID=317549 RepID=A0A6S7FUY4_PARCT|nr:Hypothetical predicted protein [Paramuricea clavata]
MVEALKKAASSNPVGRWWIKADACDVRKGLRESVCGMWAGDEDLGDGYLQDLYNKYKDDCSCVKKITPKSTSQLSVEKFQELQQMLKSYLEFLTTGESRARVAYEKVLKASRPSDNVMIELSWELIGYEELLKQNNELIQEITCIVNRFECGQQQVVKSCIVKLEPKLFNYVKQVYMKKRNAATHLMIFMISDELRNTKPYAVPVRFLPYHSITDAKLRELQSQIEDAMVAVNMVTVGFTTDGEFNSLRTKGKTRPISVVEIIMMVKREAKSINLNTLTKIFTMDERGKSINPHAAVQLEDVVLVHELMSKRSRRTPVIASRLQEFRDNPDDPADFYHNLYQPEKDVHALHDPNTGLTYESLTGKNKQSVPDCERVISLGVIEFLEKNKYVNEAKILSIIHNWHKAVDGRGLSEDLRSKYLCEMKDWILDDWMPWDKTERNYSLIDVNRSIKGICGFTRELIVGLIANLESREIRRREYLKRSLPPEHPRASSSDDVEGFVALLHEMFGLIFDLKQFYQESTKILNEFGKRIDPNLAFYYWTGVKERYRDFALPSFNCPTGLGVVERLDGVKLSRRGDPGVFVSNRASLPQRGQLTARAHFHKTPVALPPSQV